MNFNDKIVAMGEHIANHAELANDSKLALLDHVQGVVETHFDDMRKVMTATLDAALSEVRNALNKTPATGDPRTP